MADIFDQVDPKKKDIFDDIIPEVVVSAAEQTPRGGIGKELSREEARKIMQERIVQRDPERLTLVNEGLSNQNVGVKGQGFVPRSVAATVGGGFTSGPARIIQDIMLKTGMTSPEVVDALGIKRSSEENPGTVEAGNLAGGLIPAGEAFQATKGIAKIAAPAVLGGGYGLSESVKEGGVDRLANDKEQLFKDALVSAAIGSAIPAVLGSPAAAQRVIAGKIKPESAALIKSAEEMGIPLTAAQATGSRSSGLMEKFLENVPTSSGIMQNRRGQIQSGLQNKAEDLLQSTGSGQTAESFGASVQDALAPNLKKFQDQSALLYKAFEDSAPGAKIPLGNVSKVAQDFIQREGNTEGFASSKLMGELKTFLAKETPGTETVSPLIDEFGRKITSSTPATKSVPNLDLSTFQDIRAKINDEIQSLTKNEKMDAARKLTIVKTEMDKALENFAQKGGQETRNAFHVANSFYKDGAQVFFDPKIQRIIKAQPESVYGLIVKPNAVTDINVLKKALGEEGFKPVQRGFMEKVLAQEGPEAFSAAKFGTASSKFEPETLKAVFGSEKLKEIQELSKVAEAITKNERRVGNTSGTAQNTITFGYVGGTGALILSNPIGAAATVLTPPAMAKLYTSKMGTKLLTEAIQTPLNDPRSRELNAKLSAIAYGNAKGSDIQESPEEKKYRMDEEMRRMAKQVQSNAP